jgi:hypothetical protein
VIEALAAELGSARAALSLLCLRLAEAAGLLARGTCAAVTDGASALGAARKLRDLTEGALPPWGLPRNVRGERARAVLDGPAPEPFWSVLCGSAEALFAGKLGEHGRRAAGLYYTPPELADEVVALALRHGSVRLPNSVVDPCAGAGAFLCAAARAIPQARFTGADLDPEALRVARAALALCGVPRPFLLRADSLRADLAPADLLVSNPPYGHVATATERRLLLRRFPALRGGEIDRYAAFLLRSLDLVRPGGTAALLVPDTWMTNSRSGPLREALLDCAGIAAVCDLGKPFAAAKDTRVQAVVLVRRSSGARVRATRVLRGRERLADAPEAELRAAAARGWQIYRSDAERRLCAALEAEAVPLDRVCTVGYGLRTGNNARFVARRPPREGEAALVGGEDVVPFALRLHSKALHAPDEPLRTLAERQLGHPRLCIQRIRTNSRVPFARWLEAAPVAPHLVCLDSLSTVACADEELLWAVLALLNSVALQRYHRLRTTDVNVKPALLRELPVPRALLDNGGAAGLAALARARAAEAAAASSSTAGARAGRSVARSELSPALERAVDAEVYALFRLPEPSRIESERGFWGSRFAEEFPRLAQECQAPRVA